jgi:hypothetical protein
VRWTNWHVSFVPLDYTARAVDGCGGRQRGLGCEHPDLTEESATLPKTVASADQRGDEPVTLMCHRRQNDLQLWPKMQHDYIGTAKDSNDEIRTI